MEELLNKLIEKGWKPFGMEYYDRFIIESNWDMCFRWKYPWTDWESAFDYNYDYFKIRELTSKESWLWQFCIANHLLKKYSDLWDDWEYIIGRWQDWKDCKTEDWEYIDDNRDSDIYHQDDSYQYRLIESALCDEDKLEDFILDNVKIDVESK